MSSQPQATAGTPPTTTIPHATYTIGIDVGGTKIAGGLVNAQTGALYARTEIPTGAARGGRAVLDDVIRLTETLIQAAENHIAGIGVGICELVDPQGEVQSAHTVAWQGLPVQATLAALVGSESAVVESDVRAHALAEAHFGAGAHYDLFAFITVGTGISSCIVQSRVPLAGAHGNALVLASFPLEVPREDAARDTADDAGAREDTADATTHFVLEEYAAGPALTARYQQAQGRTLADGRELFTLAQKGDPRARHILQSAGAALGNSIAFLVNIIDPAAVIVGGGLGMAGGLYWQSMESALRRGVYADATRTLPVLQAQLGNDAGIIGAAMAVHTQHAQTQSPEVQTTMQSEIQDGRQ